MAKRLDRCEVEVVGVVTLFSRDPAFWTENFGTFEGSLFSLSATWREQCVVAFGLILSEYCRWEDRIIWSRILDLAGLIDKSIAERERPQKGGSIFDSDDRGIFRGWRQEMLQTANVQPIYITKPVVIEEKVELFWLGRE